MKRAVKVAGARGQALTETVLLMTLTLLATVGTVAVAHFNPGMLNALGTYVRGFYYMLALPLP